MYSSTDRILLAQCRGSCTCGQWTQCYCTWKYPFMRRFQFGLELALGSRIAFDQFVDLLRCWYNTLCTVLRTILVNLVEEIAIVDHEWTRIHQASMRGVCQPVDTPKHGTIFQVEVRWNREWYQRLRMSVAWGYVFWAAWKCEWNT